jgi:omega-6 fatty acid desaturase (delta-12 desaturase)
MCYSALVPPGDLRASIARYEVPSFATGIFQIFTSIGLFAASCAAMYWSLHVSYLLTLLLAVPTAGFVVRTFIVQHDCGHGSFFRSRRANDLVGILCSVITFTPYANWRRQHNCHHVHWNNLDKRESGADIYSACLTVREYRALSPRARFLYRIVRHPVIAHLILPHIVFLLLYRVPFDTPRSWKRERRSVCWTNVAIATTLCALALLVGIRQVLMVQTPVIMLAAVIGVLLFALQHRFEGVTWRRRADWTIEGAALTGASYFKLPPVLQWFTGNIGFHHVHHLSPRVPNYRLQACHTDIPTLQAVTTITWRDALQAIRLTLWDETSSRMVRFISASDCPNKQL